jgi:hypothetical protein
MSPIAFYYLEYLLGDVKSVVKKTSNWDTQEKRTFLQVKF